MCYYGEYLYKAYIFCGRVYLRNLKNLAISKTSVCGKMLAYWVNILVANPANLSFISRTHRWKGNRQT